MSIVADPEICHSKPTFLGHSHGAGRTLQQPNTGHSVRARRRGATGGARTSGVSNFCGPPWMLSPRTPASSACRRAAAPRSLTTGQQPHRAIKRARGGQRQPDGGGFIEFWHYNYEQNNAYWMVINASSVVTNGQRTVRVAMDHTHQFFSFAESDGYYLTPLPPAPLWLNERKCGRCSW